MSDDNRPALEELGRRIRKVGGAKNGVESTSRPPRGMTRTFRLTTEMVAALGVGGVSGWLLDGWLGTRPWLLLVFLFLGAAAGILGAYRAAVKLMKEDMESN